MTTLIAEKIHDYCEEYCAILRISMIQWRINLHRNAAERGEDDTTYHLQKIDGLVTGSDETIPTYTIESGKKYFKIVQNDGSRSVHAFVNKMNGDVYKAASWKAPVKDARYNILDDVAREHCFNSVDPFGSYLYKQ